MSNGLLLVVGMLLSCAFLVKGAPDLPDVDSLEAALIDTNFDDTSDFTSLFDFYETITREDLLLEMVPIDEHYFDILATARMAAEKNHPEYAPTLNYHIFRLNYLNSILDTPFSLGRELVNPQSTLDRDKKLNVFTMLIQIYKSYGRNQDVIALVKARYSLLQADSGSTENLSDNIDLGNAYYLEGNYDAARMHYLQVASSYEKSEVWYYAGSFYNNVGLTFRNINQPDSATYYFKKAIRCIDRVEHMPEGDHKPKGYKTYFRNLVKANMHLMNWKDKPYDFVLSVMMEEYASANHFLEYSMMVSSRINLCEFYLYHGKLRSALAMAESLDTLVNKFDFKDQYAAMYKLKGKCMLAAGKTKESFRYFARAEKIEDSLNLDKSRQQMVFAAAEFQTLKKEEELRIQKFQLQNQEIQLKSDETRQRFLIVIVAMLLVVSLLILFFFRKVRAANRIIAEQNERTKSDLETKELLLKEVNHRVKNNLQVVSGLLQKQAGLAPEKVKSYLAESQQRLESIALIHKSLYENEGFQFISFQPLAHELIQQIQGINQMEGQCIEVVSDIDEIDLHIDVATPVSLILNELINNAYKHAFEGREEGRIQISMKKQPDDSLLLEVWDNGIGLKEGFQIENLKSLGMTLVKGLSWQIHGNFSFESNIEGTSFAVSFKQRI